MKYAIPINMKNQKKMLLYLALVVAAFVLLLCAVRFARSSAFPLATLPKPGEDAPRIIVEADRENFPLQALRLFAESAAISSGGAPLAEALPLFAAGRQSALVVTERLPGIEFYGVVQLDRRDRKGVSSGKLPRQWSDLLIAPEMIPTEPKGSFELRAKNLSSSLYLEAQGNLLYIAGSFSDAEDIRKVRSGEMAAVKRKWSVGERRNGHLLLSDGGVLSAMTRASDAGKTDPLGFEAAWSNLGGEGEAEWKITGLEKKVSRNLARSLKPHDWSGERPILPRPLLLSIGVNLPNLGRNLAYLPAWAKPFAEQLTKLGVKDSEAAALLSGPAVFSVGGQTRILWFELPGVLLDVPGRGKLAHKMVDLFWSQVFMGIQPASIPGFTRGGITDLPFSVVAAANDKKLVIGLTDSVESKSPEVEKLFEKEKKAIGWLYVDLPLLGKSLAEMPSISALLSPEDEDRPIDDGSSGRLRDALGQLGKLFVVWDTPSGGKAKWSK